MQVDVWATGILAYELVVGRPPFEVNDEVQTATMIMFSNNIVYPPKHSALWADFVKVALEKKPHIRPTALQMLDHPWYAPLYLLGKKLVFGNKQESYDVNSKQESYGINSNYTMSSIL